MRTHPGTRRLLPLALALGLSLATPAAGADDLPEANHPQRISAEELLVRIVDGTAPVIVDVRGVGSYQRDHIPGAIAVSSQEIVANTDVLAKYREQGIVVYCGNGRKSSRSALALTKAGFRKVYVLEGTIRNWRFSGYPLETPEPEPSKSE